MDSTTVAERRLPPLLVGTGSVNLSTQNERDIVSETIGPSLKTSPSSDNVLR